MTPAHAADPNDICRSNPVECNDIDVPMNFTNSNINSTNTNNTNSNTTDDSGFANVQE